MPNSPPLYLKHTRIDTYTHIHTHTHIYIYIYIYSHPKTDYFVVSRLYCVARHGGRFKLGSKPALLYARLSILLPADLGALRQLGNYNVLLIAFLVGLFQKVNIEYSSLHKFCSSQVDCWITGTSKITWSRYQRRKSWWPETGLERNCTMFTSLFQSVSGCQSEDDL